MSFGDPNNPYGPPQGQPGYGQPQQPGYGYPVAPPPGQPYGGYPAVPVQMPGTVRAARVMLFVLAGFQALGGVAMIAASAWFAEYFEELLESDSTISSQDAETIADIGAGIVIFFGAVVLLFGLWAFLNGLRFATGRGGVRVSAIIYASLVTLFSVLSLLGGNFFALISLVLGVLIIVYSSNSNGSIWFNRPNY
ncbi:hypothetical protein Stsp02_06550 [Streptomyces sp. NBRC 14336]|uniref:hypothetical protein n=1 Tax=Streptomyces sp. NBRC 14336 TaxID=3030992 RepID=UPI0024A2D5B2|nr:hypothetical protein [Streptomyces sp. NBRC 14336]WBO79903.1 hypothetical protein SBE_003638 [Streptomyces sp. SBE_14.2]GLW44993.1 hypothetical protein Stsp02_06550 [Streptomyces sp. NBRC 14336]